MVSVYQLKPAFQNLLRPMVGGLARMGVTANQVTILACLISIVYGGILWFNPTCKLAMGLLPAWMLGRMALNAVDGMLAREFGMKSKLGAILNEMTDVISDAALFLPFAIIEGFSPVLIVVIVLLATLTEMLGVVAQTIGASRRYDGPMGKSDRALVFGVLGLLLGLSVNMVAVLWYIQIAMIVLLILTLWNRGRRALNEVAQ